MLILDAVEQKSGQIDQNKAKILSVMNNANEFINNSNSIVDHHNVST